MVELRFIYYGYCFSPQLRYTQEEHLSFKNCGVRCLSALKIEIAVFHVVYSRAKFQITLSIGILTTNLHRQFDTFSLEGKPDLKLKGAYGR